MLSGAPLEVVVSTEVLVVAVSSDAAFAFFFLADLDSDLTAGFWIVAAAILNNEHGRI